MSTRAMAVKEALVSKLEALAIPPAPENATDANVVPIWYGYETTSDRPREVIWVGEVRWSDETYQALGNLSKEETFDIVVTAEVHIPGHNQRQANTRALELFGYVEELVRDPRWTGLPNIVASNLRPQFMGEGPDGESGRGTVLVSFLRVTARK